MHQVIIEHQSLAVFLSAVSKELRSCTASPIPIAAEHKVVIILKGATDIISDGETTYTNPKKTPSMTVGGTGDVLSGLVAGMLAKNRNALQAASAAVFVNGLAGAAAQEKFGLHILATDVCDNIPYVMKSFDRIGDNA